MELHELRRGALDLWLKGARLPLTAAETVVKRGEDTSSWPPSVAFEKLEATVKDLVGRAVRDEQLVALARLQRAEVAKRDQAIRKRAEADAIRAAAEQQADAEREELQDLRAEVEARADEREEQVDQVRTTAKRQVEARASKKKAAARRSAAATKQANATKAKQAEKKRLEEEARAMRAKEAAVDAEGEVLDLDRAARAKKAARRAG